MATNSVSTLASCELCSQHFSDPRMLPCLHSFYYDCLVKHFDAAKSEYKCPTCKEAFELPDSKLEGLTKDLHATYVAEVADYEDKLANKGEVYCDRCIVSSESAAIKFCCNCCKFLCNWCTKDHMRREKTHNHELVDVGEKKDRQYEKSLLNSIPHKVMHCREHSDEVLKFYCKKCSELICRDCMALSHDGHSYNRIEPIAKEEKSKLLPFVTEANFAASKLEDAMAKNGKVIQNIKVRQKSVDDDIRNCFKDLREILNYRERSLLALSSEVGLGKITALQLQSEEMMRLYDEITRVSGHITEATETYTPAEMLAAKELMTAKLAALIKLFKACPLDPCKNESIHTDFNNHLVVEAIEKFGAITEGCYAHMSTAALYYPWAIKDKEKKVTIITRDFRGDLFSRGGEVVKARIAVKDSGEFNVAGVVKDNNDGTYEVTVTPVSLGKHELSITIGNEPIKLSPFDIDVWEKRDYSSLSCQKSFSVPYPFDVAIGDNNELFAVNYSEHCIKVINMEDDSSRSIGASGNKDLEFKNPSAIAIRGDVLYVTEYSNHRIQKITTAGEHIFTLGCNGSGEGEFKSPRGICIDPDGKIYISESGNNRISVFTADWTFDRFITEKLKEPRGIALDNSGNLIVANYGCNTFEVFTPEGKHVGSYGSGKLTYATGVAVDPEGYIFISEYNGSSSRLRVFDPDYQVQEKAFQEFNNAVGIKLDKNGFIYVTDYGNAKVKKY